MPKSKVGLVRRERVSIAYVVLEYVNQYATNAHQEDEEDGAESDGELSEVGDFKSDDDEPAGAMEDV
jgi:hypothetical protein